MDFPPNQLALRRKLDATPSRKHSNMWRMQAFLWCCALFSVVLCFIFCVINRGTWLFAFAKALFREEEEEEEEEDKDKDKDKEQPMAARCDARPHPVQCSSQSVRIGDSDVHLFVAVFSERILVRFFFPRREREVWIE